MASLYRTRVVPMTGTPDADAKEINGAIEAMLVDMAGKLQLKDPERLQIVSVALAPVQPFGGRLNMAVTVVTEF